MQWSEVRAAHPDQWLVVDVLESHRADGLWILDRLAVVEVCPDGRTAMKRYRALRGELRCRELCFIHTSQDTADIIDGGFIGSRWLVREAARMTCRSSRWS